MSKLSTITLTGKSKIPYTFNVYPRSDTFKALGAVYVMSRRTLKPDGTGDHSFIYIGETGDLSNRPLNHHRKGCFDNNAANAVLIYVENDATKRLSIETDLRGGYSTPCNQQ